MKTHTADLRCKRPMSSSSLSQQDAAHLAKQPKHVNTGPDTCKHKHPVRSKLECGGSRRSGHVLLWIVLCARTLSGMNQRRRGMEGAIKLKRLGEDELLRIHDNRHWLYNPNPVKSASKDRLGWKRGRMQRTGVNPCVQTAKNQVIDYLHELSVQMTVGAEYCFTDYFSMSVRAQHTGYLVQEGMLMIWLLLTMCSGVTAF